MCVLRVYFLVIVLCSWTGQTIASPLQLEGQFIQGGLVQGRVEPGSKVKFNGRWVRVSEQGDFLIGFGREAPSTASLTVVFPDGSREERMLEVAPREYDIQHINGLPPWLAKRASWIRRAPIS